MTAPRLAWLIALFGILFLPVTAADAAGFAMSDNFTVLTSDWPSPGEANQYAQEVLQNAEQWRIDIAREWLGQELPPGVGQTTVNVSLATERDAGLTWAKDDPRRRYHTLYLTTSPERALGGTLAHEMAHVVLATRFPHPRRLPAWMEEGIASRYDDDDRVQLRQQQIDWIVRTGNWPRVDGLLSASNISARDKQAYALAASLIDFLLSLNADKQVILEFGQHASQAGWDAALRKYYHIQDVSQLQTRWQRWLTS